jgi:hypothetical protein
MPSKKTADDPFAVDFERDVPTTSADLEALARARQLRPLSADEYQQWVDLVHAHHPPPDRDETGREADEPFSL